MREMKDSKIEWLNEIPLEWKLLKIKRLSEIKRGASPRPIDNPEYFDENGHYGWTRISDITKSNMYLENTEQKLSELGSSLSVKLEPGELFLSICASVGKACITKIPTCIHDGFVYFPQLNINNKLLYYIFQAGKCFDGLGNTGTQLNLNTTIVGNIYITISSSLEEQQLIVDYLDQKTALIDKIIYSKEEQIELLKEQKQAIITEAVTKGLNPDVKMVDSRNELVGVIPEHWKVSKIKQISSNFTTKGAENSDGYIEIGDIDIVTKKYELKNKKSVKGCNKSYENDILISTVRPTRGCITVVKEKEINVSNAFYIINKVKEIESDFLFYYLNNRSFFEYLGSNCTGSTYPTVNGNYIDNYIVLLPPIEEQTQIAKYLELFSKNLDVLLEKLKTEIEQLKEYKQSLIFEAVTGKIDLTDNT